MTDSEKDQARRELAHALDALKDGAGQEVWGPGVVGAKLWDRSSNAGWAFDEAANTVFRAMRYGRLHEGGPLTDVEGGPFIENMRKLAPVVLELLLDE